MRLDIMEFGGFKFLHEKVLIWQVGLWFFSPNFRSFSFAAR